MGAYLVDRVGLDGRVDEFSDKLALEVLYPCKDKYLQGLSLEGVACLEEELLCTDAQGLLAGSLKVLQP